MIRPSSSNVKGGFPGSRRYLLAYLALCTVVVAKNTANNSILHVWGVYCGTNGYL